jgi:hypothetical protein
MKKLLYLFTLSILLSIPSFAQQNNHEEEEDNHALERQELDFDQVKIPGTNIVPIERLMNAEVYKKQLIANRAASRNTSSLVTGTWEERGGNNCSGLVRAIMYDPNDPTHKRVFAGGFGGGIWKCDDIKSINYSWVNVNDQHPNLYISDFTYNPANTLIMYAATGGSYGSSSRAQNGAGIYKSIDGGVNWNLIPSIQNNPDFAKITKIACTLIGDIFISTETAGIQKSTDGGETWTKVLGNGLQGCTSDIGSDVEIAANGSIYVCFGYRTNLASAWKSIDNGVTWINITPTQIASLQGRIEIESALSNSNKIIIVSSNNDFLKSLDAGITWTNLTTTGNFAGPQGSWDLFCEISPQDENVIVCGGTDGFISYDGGVTINSVGGAWYEYEISANNATNPNLHADIHNVIFEPGNNQNTIWATDGGVFAINSINVTNVFNGNATPKTKGLNIAQYYAAAISANSGSNYMLTGAQDNGTHLFSAAGLNDVTGLTRGDGGFCHIDETFGYIMSVQDGKNYIGSDQYTLPNPNNIPFSSFINPTAWDSRSGNLFTAAQNGVGRFELAGNGSYTNSNFIACGAVGISKITALQVDPNFDNVVWAIGGDKVYKITNVNTTAVVTTYTIPIINALANASCIEIEKNGNSNHILVTYSSYGVAHILESTNGGTTWNSVQNTFPDIPCRWVVFNPLNTSQVLLATELGVWETDFLNGGSTIWQPSGSNFPNTRVSMLKVRPSDGLLVAATFGRGLWSTFLTYNNSTSCISPTNLNYSFSSPTSVTFNWSPSLNAINYTLEYKVSFGSPWIILASNNSTTNFTSTNLPISLCSTYYWRVKANCSIGSSPYTNSTFSYNQIQNVIVSNNIQNQATISWDPIIGATQYSIRYKVSTEAPSNVVSTTNTSITLTGLKGCTNYKCTITANNGSCLGEKEVSFLSGNYLLSPPSGLSLSNVNSLITGSIDSDGWGIFQWNTVPNAEYYLFEYKLSTALNWNWFYINSTFNNLFYLDGNGLIPCSNYDWRVSAKNSCGYSLPATGTFINNTAILPPANLSTSGVGNSIATLKWVSGASISAYGGGLFNSGPGYKIQYKLQSSTTWIDVNNATSPTTLTYLIPNTTYDWRVCVVSNCATPIFTQSTFTTSNLNPGEPSIPTNLVATQTNCVQAQVTLNWAASTGTGITYYITRTFGTNSIIFTSLTNSFVDNNVLPNNNYTYSVVASNTAGNSIASNTALISISTAPFTPTGLIVNPFSGVNLRVGWDNIIGVTYNIYKGINGATPVLFQTGITSTAAPAFYLDNAVSGGNTYCYYIVANTGNCSSLPTANVCYTTTNIAPSAPILDYAVQSYCNPIGVKILWNSFPAGTLFTITRTNGSNVVITTSSGITLKNDFTVLPGNTYYYTITASNFAGTSAPSNAIPVAVYTPGTLTNLSAIQNGNSATLTWNANSGLNVINGYTIFRGLGSNTPTPIANTTTSATTFIDNTIIPGNSYCYKVNANSTLNVPDYFSADAGDVPSTRCAGPSNVACIAAIQSPTNLTVAQTACAQATINWPAVTGSGITYTITRTNGATSVNFAIATNSYIDNSVIAGITYSYSVVANSSSGTSPSSNIEPLTIATVPATATSVTGIQTSISSVQINWVASTTVGVQYKLVRSPGNIILASNLNTNSFQDFTVVAGTTYTYTVQAIKQNCYSVNSNIVSVNVLANFAPIAPSNFTVIRNLYSGLTMSITFKDNASDETNFILERSTTSNFSAITSQTLIPLVSSLSGTTITTSVSVPNANTVYYYRIRAIRTTSTAPITTYSSVNVLPTPSSATSATFAVPTSFTSAAISNTEVQLNWVNNATAATGIEIWRAPTATGTYTLLYTVTPTTTSYIHTGITASTANCYKIRAVINSPAASTAYTSNLCTTTFASFISAPTNLVVTKPAATTGTLKLNWTDNSSTENGFEIYRSLDNLTFTKIITTAANIVTYTNTGLVVGTTYYYKVRAVKLSGTTVTAVTDYSNTSSPLSARMIDNGIESPIVIENSFDIAPNPVNSTLNISYNSINNAKISLIILTENGSTIMVRSENVTKGDNKFSINTSKLITGFYKIVIINNDNKLEKSFIKE